MSRRLGTLTRCLVAVVAIAAFSLVAVYVANTYDTNAVLAPSPGDLLQ